MRITTMLLSRICASGAMSELVGHECGFTFLKLRKGYGHYVDQYGEDFLLKIQGAMLAKQRNRGQQAAGMATVDGAAKPGSRYLYLNHVLGPEPIDALFNKLYGYIHSKDPNYHRGTISIAHVRYATADKNIKENAHPIFAGDTKWRTKNIVVASNGNFTNKDEQQEWMVRMGMWPRSEFEMYTVADIISKYLELEHDRLYNLGLSNQDISRSMQLQNVLGNASKHFDGAYALCGIVGNGDGFVASDPHGIRPTCYCVTDDFIAAASESLALTSVLNVPKEEVRHLGPGQMLIVKNDL